MMSYVYPKQNPVDLVSYPYKSSKTNRFDPPGREGSSSTPPRKPGWASLKTQRIKT